MNETAKLRADAQRCRRIADMLNDPEAIATLKRYADELLKRAALEDGDEGPVGADGGRYFPGKTG